MPQSLLERVGSGDMDAMSSCLSTYGGLVWALVRRQATDANDAEDATQEIFIDLWQSAGRFDPRVTSEATFVAMIARRRLIDRFRKRNRALPTLPLPAEGGIVCQTVNELVDTADEVAVVRACMAEISPDQRKVLEMAIDRGMSQANISSALNIPLGTVKAHARRGLLRLKELVTGRSTAQIKRGNVR